MSPFGPDLLGLSNDFGILLPDHDADLEREPPGECFRTPGAYPVSSNSLLERRRPFRSTNCVLGPKQGQQFVDLLRDDAKAPGEARAIQGKPDPDGLGLHREGEPSWKVALLE
jgi:hypothetical protein